jgi:type IV conjugative transfer system protein TraE
VRIERYLAGRREHGLLKLSVLVLVLGLIAEGVLVLLMSRQQRVVLVPPALSEHREIWVSDEAASAAYFEDLTRFLLPLLADVHPRNLDVQFSLFLRYVAPEAYGAVKAQLLAQAERARRNDLAQVFYIQNLDVKDQTVRATGLLRRFVGKTSTSEEVATYEVRYEMRRGRPVVVGVAVGAPPGVGAPERVGP